VEVEGNTAEQVVDNIQPEVFMAHRLAVVTSRHTGLLRLEAQLLRSAATPAAAAPEASKAKVTLRFAISQAIPKHRTFTRTAIDGSVMTGAETTRGTVRITYGNTDISAVRLVATTFIASKAEAGTVFGLAASSGVWLLTTMTTPAIGCGTTTTS
jgi:outer membrane protein W